MYKHSQKKKDVQPQHLIATSCHHLVFIEFLQTCQQNTLLNMSSHNIKPKGKMINTIHHNHL